MSPKTRILVEVVREKDSRDVNWHVELDTTQTLADPPEPEEKYSTIQTLKDLGRTYLLPLISEFVHRPAEPFVHPDPPHPGDVVAEYLESMGWSVAQLATAADITVLHAQGVLDGNLSIDEHLAVKLEEHLGRPAHFWLNLQDQYDLAQEGDDAETETGTEGAAEQEADEGD